MKQEKMSAKDLVKLVEDHGQIEEIGKVQRYKEVLNNPTPKAWQKKNPYANNTLYIPIDKVEMLLDTIFMDWRVEVLHTAQLANAIATTVRLHYKNPTTGEWNFHDGVGAVDIQTQKGASPADLAKIQTNAIMKALPASKSYAIKNAAAHLGKLFGRDLNREDTIDYNGVYINEEQQMKTAEAKKQAIIESLKKNG